MRGISQRFSSPASRPNVWPTTHSAPNREIEHGRACCHLQQRQPRLRFDPDTEIHVNRSDVDLIMEPLAFANSSPGSSRGQQLIQLGVGGRKRNQNEDNR